MTEPVKAQGTCLCGAVTLTAKRRSPHVGVCHCTLCRTWGGGPLFAVDCGTEVTVEGDDQLGVYPSSDWAERGFCRRCGTHLFYRLKQNQQYIVSAGLFGDPPDFVFNHQVFIDEKPPYYSFAEQTETLTGAEVFAQFAPPAD